MKKILCCMVLMMVTMTISAMAQMKAYSQIEQDIGYSEMVTTLSFDGQSVFAFDSQLNMVDLHTPVMLNMEGSNVYAQVVDVYSTQTEMGVIGMTLVFYRWPDSNILNKNATNPNSNNEKSQPSEHFYFTEARTDHT